MFRIWWASWIWKLISFIKFGKSLAILFPYQFMFLLLWETNDTNCKHFSFSYKSLKLNFFNLFFTMFFRVGNFYVTVFKAHSAFLQSSPFCYSEILILVSCFQLGFLKYLFYLYLYVWKFYISIYFQSVQIYLMVTPKCIWYFQHLRISEFLSVDFFFLWQLARHPVCKVFMSNNYECCYENFKYVVRLWSLITILRKNVDCFD